MLPCDRAFGPFGPLRSVPAGPIAGGPDALLLRIRQHAIDHRTQLEDPTMLGAFLYAPQAVAFACTEIKKLGLFHTQLTHPTGDFHLFQDSRGHTVVAYAHAFAADEFYPEPLLIPLNAPSTDVIAGLAQLWAVRANGPTVAFMNTAARNAPHPGILPTWLPYRPQGKLSSNAIADVLTEMRHLLQQSGGARVPPLTDTSATVLATLSTPARTDDMGMMSTTARVEVHTYDADALGTKPWVSGIVLRHTRIAERLIGALPGMENPHLLGMIRSNNYPHPVEHDTPLYIPITCELTWGETEPYSAHAHLALVEKWASA